MNLGDRLAAPQPMDRLLARALSAHPPPASDFLRCEASRPMSPLVWGVCAIDPPTAGILLEQVAPNRPLSDEKVRSMSDALRQRGGFPHSGAPYDALTLDPWLRVLNGRHRLTAIYVTGIQAYLMLVQIVFDPALPT